MRARTCVCVCVCVYKAAGKMACLYVHRSLLSGCMVLFGARGEEMGELVACQRLAPEVVNLLIPVAGCCKGV